MKIKIKDIKWEKESNQLPTEATMEWEFDDEENPQFDKELIWEKLVEQYQADVYNFQIEKVEETADESEKQSNKSYIAYKVFNPDWTCRNFKYEVGKTYEMPEKPICCQRGFHFCDKLIDCFDYYNFNFKNKAAEVEILGDIDTDKNKKCTNKIKILRELSWHEVFKMVNIGKNCTGYRNTGDCNTGNNNTGYFNSGDCNTGDNNTGDFNSGDCNTGDYNTGDYNAGNHNTGNHNTGYFNSGDFNTGYFNSGDFNTVVISIRVIIPVAVSTRKKPKS